MKMIERWFPSADVSEASAAGWGTGNIEKALFAWFAARPLAQAKAAVLTSLLPWPDLPEEQRKLQVLVRQSLTGLDGTQQDAPEVAANLSNHHRDAQRAVADEALREILKGIYSQGARMLDPFSGRGMVPLEAVKLGVRAHGIDYSPVATLAGQLLADYPFRDWSGEPALPFANRVVNPMRPRLLQDVEILLAEIGGRFATAMSDFFPKVRGTYPWGYLWAVTLPCQRQCAPSLNTSRLQASGCYDPSQHREGVSGNRRPSPRPVSDAGLEVVIRKRDRRFRGTKYVAGFLPVHFERRAAG